MKPNPLASPVSAFRLPTDFDHQIAAVQPPTSDFRPPASDLRFPLTLFLLAFGLLLFALFGS